LRSATDEGTLIPNEYYSLGGRREKEGWVEIIRPHERSKQKEKLGTTGEGFSSRLRGRGEKRVWGGGSDGEREKGERKVKLVAWRRSGISKGETKSRKKRKSNDNLKTKL